MENRPGTGSATALRSALDAELNLASIVCQIECHLSRIADHFDPPPPDKVDTAYVAERLGCTTDYVAMLARDGGIPPSCLVKGTGNGKPWKFHRSQIETWIASR